MSFKPGDRVRLACIPPGPLPHLTYTGNCVNAVVKFVSACGQHVVIYQHDNLMERKGQEFTVPIGCLVLRR